ncbi:MAG: hypothetical protein H6765_02290 [Candidatus Peribacteria bacterium]|nr:MAG: hypothetical protein H6765_02290 [Candidatus Peribacteria bacterium]
MVYLPAEENWWGPAGATGPCGPDTEIYYWIGEGEPPKVFDFAKDEDNWLEIWNNVFMAYYKDEAGVYQELEQKNVDTGMGFERLSLVMQSISGELQKPIRSASIYDTDIFRGILDALAPNFVSPYPGRSKMDNEFTDLDRRIAVSYRIIADHLRTSVMLVSEGLTPSNE